MDHIADSTALKGGNIQHLHDCFIIIGNGNRIIGKALIAALHFRAGKHKHLGLAGQDGAHDYIVSLRDIFLQIALQTKIARLAGHGHIISLRREEVKLGKSGFLLGSLHKRTDFSLIRKTL